MTQAYILILRSYKGSNSVHFKSRVVCELKHDTSNVYQSFAMLPLSSTVLSEIHIKRDMHLIKTKIAIICFILINFKCKKPLQKFLARETCKRSRYYNRADNFNKSENILLEEIFCTKKLSQLRYTAV